jgi:stress-induced morphogen
MPTPLPASAPTALSEALTAQLQAALPGATVVVHDPDGAHLSAEVVWAGFAGMSRIQQHRAVNTALGDAFATVLHALQLQTRVT